MRPCELVFEAMRWACKDAVTGAQVDSPYFRKCFPDGIKEARSLNDAICLPVCDIEKITLESLVADGYMEIAARELAKKREKQEQ